jgi:hypothetical protein
VLWRRSLVGSALALALGCTGPVLDGGDPLAAPPGVETTTSTSSTTTTAPPPADIQALIEGTTMTERARRIFLAASPAIEDVETFTRNCGVEHRAGTAGEPRVHTQGCYVAGRIHLLAPDRPEGHDLLHVVAAHELLHVVYAGLRPAEREAVDAEVVAARAGNERLEERLRPYGAGPTLVNEMHAILGSEFDGLSPALEAHYAQYFTNRAAVVAARQRTLGAREEEIRRLRAEIDVLDARLIDLKVLQERLRAAGDVRTYNANVATINGLVDRYNRLVDTLNAVIEEYNGLLGR